MDGLRYQTPDHLMVICHKCTREAKIRGKDEEQASRIAEALGWRKSGNGMVCPRCPGGGKPDAVALELELLELQRSV